MGVKSFARDVLCRVKNVDVARIAQLHIVCARAIKN